MHYRILQIFLPPEVYAAPLATGPFISDALAIVQFFSPFQADNSGPFCLRLSMEISLDPEHNGKKYLAILYTLFSLSMYPPVPLAKPCPES